jgi:DNA replication protein DnaC
MEMLRRCHVVEWLAVRDVPEVLFSKEQHHIDRRGRFKELDLLVLDDIGAQRFKLNGAAGTALEDLARDMFDAKRPMVFTSNVDWGDVATTFDAIKGLVSLMNRVSIPVKLNEVWGNNPLGGSSGS